MKQRIYLNDGPLSDIVLIGDHELMEHITSVNIEVAVPEKKRMDDEARDQIPVPDDLELYGNEDDDEEEYDVEFDDDEHDLFVDQLNLETHRYDRFDSWTAEKENEVQHAFFHQATQSAESPVTTGLWSRINEVMTGPDRERWNHWRFMLFRLLENVRETARRYECNPVVDEIEECQSLVTNIPVMTVPD